MNDAISTFKGKVAKYDYFDEPTKMMLDFIREKGRVYVRPQRTASTSISEVIGGDNRHMGAFMYKKALGKDWKKLFVFTSCRNPYTRFVSSYNAFAKDPRDINKYLDEEGVERLLRVRFFPFLPQHAYMYKDGKKLVDYIIRFEKLKEGWAYVQKKLGIKRKLPHIGKTKKVKLSDKNKDIVYEIYKEDFELLGYER